MVRKFAFSFTGLVWFLGLTAADLGAIAIFLDFTGLIFAPGLNGARVGSIGVVVAVLLKQPCEVQVCTIPRGGTGRLQPIKTAHRAQMKNNSLINSFPARAKFPFPRFGLPAVALAATIKFMSINIGHHDHLVGGASSAESASPPTQIIEGVQGRTDLLTDLGLRINVLKTVNQRGIFGTQFFSQFVNSLKLLIEFFDIARLVGLLHLVTELGHLAIDSNLGLVAADYSEDLLRLRFGHLRRSRRLSLHTWHGGNHKNGKNYSQVSVVPPAMMIPDPKKVTK